MSIKRVYEGESESPVAENPADSTTTHVEIPTDDTHGGNISDNATQRQTKKLRVSEIRKEVDPFLFYSIPKNKRIHLLGRDDPDQPDQAEQRDEEITPSNIRKTRISFEMHSHAIFESMFTELGWAE